MVIESVNRMWLTARVYVVFGIAPNLSSTFIDFDQQEKLMQYIFQCTCVSIVFLKPWAMNWVSYFVRLFLSLSFDTQYRIKIYFHSFSSPTTFCADCSNTMMNLERVLTIISENCVCIYTKARNHLRLHRSYAYQPNTKEKWRAWSLC